MDGTHTGGPRRVVLNGQLMVRESCRPLNLEGWIAGTKPTQGVSSTPFRLNVKVEAVVGKRVRKSGQIYGYGANQVLIVGESAYKIHVHFKGFASYETGYLSAGLEGFTDRFADKPVSFQFMHNHDISLRFPFTLAEMRAYDVIVISDAPADSFLLHPQTLAGEIMPNRLAVIGDYVRAGGGFAMIGGWMSFGGFHGKAHYAYSPLAGAAR